jgi:hypothetical protein
MGLQEVVLHAYAAASARDRTPSLPKMLLTCR